MGARRSAVRVRPELAEERSPGRAYRLRQVEVEVGADARAPLHSWPRTTGKRTRHGLTVPVDVEVRPANARDDAPNADLAQARGSRLDVPEGDGVRLLDDDRSHGTPAARDE